MRLRQLSDKTEELIGRSKKLESDLHLWLRH